jgi:hypothetical protein
MECTKEMKKRKRGNRQIVETLLHNVKSSCYYNGDTKLGRKWDQHDVKSKLRDLKMGGINIESETKYRIKRINKKLGWEYDNVKIVIKNEVK